MNIIFYRYKSICEPDYIDAFKSLGIDVIEDTDAIDASYPLEEKISRLGNLIADNRPLFVFSINYLPFIALLCERLHVYYVSQTVDCPVFEIYNTSMRSSFNRMFLFDKDQFESVHSENPAGTFHLPLGGATIRLSSLLADTSDFKYEVSFIGSLYNEKDPLGKLSGLSANTKLLLDVAIESQLDGPVYGQKIMDECLDPESVNALIETDKDFYPSDMSICDISRYVALNDYLSPHATYKERVKVLNLLAEGLENGAVSLFTTSDTSALTSRIRVMGPANSLTEMPFIFRQSKINLNITTRSITSGLSQRIWDVLSCGGFLITNYQPEIDLYFKDGVHLVTYHSYEELLEKVRYYLDHEDERVKIARNGFNEVLQNGSVQMRVISMIQTITGGSNG